MSILIKGMEMPKNCAGCPFFVRSDSPKRPLVDCKLIGCLGSVFVAGSGIPVDCPLVPVPPHGRLIDADALLKRFEKEEKAADEHGRDFSFSFKSGGENCTEWWPVQVMLMDAPTIIPAEEGE